MYVLHFDAGLCINLFILNKVPGAVGISLKKLRLVYFDLVGIEQLSISILAS